ncbi:arylsulfatase [Sediminitomix flava]|uniref:Arylsulfatase A-like enzyme n=1 Tax=Sediminitomix flava TaxID=379075 RepID=A0A315Z5U6_SEDFL|nr:arylsulfatase [Sediminitomix flava]PWJ37946.1 arylsulfatase A-like enzyme [Sediminitomix flava]
MKNYIHQLFSGLLLGLHSFMMFSCEKEQDRPNVILIITDDQGYGDIAAHGNKVVSTPNIDQLFQESTRLSNFHVSPTCAPSRAGIMTGKYPNRVGVWHTVMGRSILYEQEKTMANVFRDNGYATGLFGKWHLGDNYPYSPQFRGFQEVLTHGAGGVGQTPDYWNNDYFDDVYLRNGKEEEVNGYCTDVWFKEALSFIEKNKDNKQPFFCYISTNAPHGPLNVPMEYAQPYLENGVAKDRAKFYGMITNIDDNLGALRNQLEDWKIADNTILIYMTDNGTAYGAAFKGSELKNGFNANMRGKKGSAYDGGHRVPFYIHWKDGKIDTGRDIDALTAHIDILPTLIGLCNLEQTTINFDGDDLSEAIKGKEEIKDRILIGDSQRLEYPEKWRNSYTMTKEWRLINGKELYNIKQDPSQSNDIAAEHSGMVKRLRKAYETNWEDQKKSFSQFPYIKLGTKQEAISVLTAHDWHVSEEQRIPWNHQMIRKGTKGNGEWRVDFTKASRYKISLRRWPIESDLALNESAERLETQAKDYILQKGKIFNFKKAFLKVGDQVWEEEVVEGSKEVTFSVDVPKGENVMSAYFETAEGNIQGAYYTYVEEAKLTAK